MEVNESPTERIARSSVGAFLVIFAFFLEGPYDIFQGMFGIALLVIGGLSLVTGLFGRCPVYALCGVKYPPER